PLDLVLPPTRRAVVVVLPPLSVRTPLSFRALPGRRGFVKATFDSPVPSRVCACLPSLLSSSVD
ncbi:hypothetical protein CSUI_010095, partial [Cystoisospora suis]